MQAQPVNVPMGLEILRSGFGWKEEGLHEQARRRIEALNAPSSGRVGPPVGQGIQEWSHQYDHTRGGVG